MAIITIITITSVLEAIAASEKRIAERMVSAVQVPHHRKEPMVLLKYSGTADEKN